MTSGKGQLIAGLDVGTTHVRIAVGQNQHFSGEKGNINKLNIVGAVEVPVEGISKGNIVSIEDAVRSINACVDRAERMVGQSIEKVWLGVGGNSVVSREGRGVAAVSRGDNEICDEDVERAVEASRMGVESVNYEILHVIPKEFIVDGQAGIKDPVGMNGIRLEVITQIILGLTSQIKNLTKCVYRSGLDIEDIVFSGLAVAEAVLTSKQKELGVVLVNIGGSITNLVVYEDGDVIHTAVLPIGSAHITSDVAIGLRISIDLAEKIKIEYGNAVAKNCDKGEQISVGDFDGAEEEKISRKYVCDIIEARTEELLEKINNELKKIGRDGLLPAGVVMVGGGAKLSGLVELAKNKLRLPVSLGTTSNITSVVDKVQDLSFFMALGLVKWGAQLANEAEVSSSAIKKIGSWGEKIKKWFKSLIP